MKKSRIAKLALMGASITALAATLTTSTYAWYVSNKTANVEGGSGSTGSATADGSILLSWDNSAESYFKTLDFSEAPAATTTNNDLSPCHYDTDGFYSLSDAGAKGLASSAYIQFSLYIKAAKAVTLVTPTMTFSNWSGSTTQVAYVDDGLPSGKQKGQTFSVSADKAVYTQQNNGGTMTYAAASTASPVGDAHDYWEAVTGNTITWGRTPASATGLAGFALAANTPLQLTYTIFLEGGDPDCFNSCAGYTFDFELTFQITTE